MFCNSRGAEPAGLAPVNAEEQAQFDTTDMDFSDPEDYVDEIDDEELLADILKTRPKETDGVDNVIIVDGCPAGIGPERCEKLKGVIRKIYQGTCHSCS